ncbi:hypothetical protein ACFYW6_06915, partial [Streptomyces sp. NPDC002659]|uniref:hypothetical protein n=1 Tax=Streptomyces sp. NPDC002659 TaxID=3364656 RepID=UPI0036980638
MTSVPKWVQIGGTVLAFALLALFFAVAFQVAQTAGDPPRLADPAPTSPPTTGQDGALPPQYRGSYDPHTRLLGLLAIVSPLLTTIIGFYFGQRAGEASGQAAKNRAQGNQAQIAQRLYELGEPEAVQDLKDKGLLVEAKGDPKGDPKADPPDDPKADPPDDPPADPKADPPDDPPADPKADPPDDPPADPKADPPD